MGTYEFAIDFEFTEPEDRVDVYVFERDEAKAFTPSCFTIQHDGRVNYSTKLGKVFAHGF